MNMFGNAVFLGQVALAMGQPVPSDVEKEAKEAMDLARKKIEELNRKGQEQGGGLTDDQWKEFKKWDEVWKAWKKVLDAYRRPRPTQPGLRYPVTYPCPMCDPPIPVPIPPLPPPRPPTGGGISVATEGPCPPGQFRPARGAPCRGSVGPLPRLPGELPGSGGGMPVATSYLSGGRLARGSFGESIWT